MQTQLQELLSRPPSHLTHRHLRRLLALLKAHPHSAHLALLPSFLPQSIRPLSIKLIAAELLGRIGVLKQTPFRMLLQAAQRVKTVEFQKGNVWECSQGGWVSLQGELTIQWEKGTQRNQYLGPCNGKTARKRIRLQQKAMLLFLPKDIFKRIFDFRATQQVLRRTSFLREIPQFDCFSQKALLLGLDNTKERVLKFGQFLCRKGEKQDVIYAIQEGQVTLSYGHPLPLLSDSFRKTSEKFSDFCAFGKGELVGIEAAYGYQRKFSVRCTSEKLRVQVIDLAYLKSRMSTPQFLEMFQNFSSQLKLRFETLLQKVGRSKSSGPPLQELQATKNKSLNVKRGSEMITHFISERSPNQRVSAQFLLREKLKVRTCVSKSETFKEKRVKEEIVLIKRLEQQSPYYIKKRRNSFLLELLQENRIQERSNKKGYLHRSIKF